MFGFASPPSDGKGPKLDQKRISEILGSTMRPVGPGGPLATYMESQAEAREEAQEKKKAKKKE